MPIFPTCGHNGKPYQPFQCTSHLSMKDIREFHAAFYQNKDKRGQDMFILRHCDSKVPVRQRKRKENKNKPKSCILSYKLKRSDGLTVPVCRSAFQGILGIKKDRILNIMKRYKQNSLIPVERRGGDRVGQKNEGKKESIKKFIESLKCAESHYCRSKTINRIYLPAELSITKVWKMYNDQMDQNEDLKVKECFFRDYFNKHFNVGFGTPKTDLCSTCLQYKFNMQKETDETKKTNLAAQQRLHKLRADSFYTCLQEEKEDLVTFSFDCQKNLALPKLPDQSAYFSMQINFYHLAVVFGSSKSKLTTENVSSYVWTELDRPRSSNEISSFLHHFLSKFTFVGNVKIIRFICDGCGAQNKNSTLIGMLSYWLQYEAPRQIEQIQILFPVVGHSYIPPDRVFGQIERVYKKNTVVIHPDEYVNLIKKFATVYRVGTDVQVKDWKNETQKVLKQPGYWHFKFQPSKRIILFKGKTGVPLVRGEAFYKNDLCTPKSLCKRGKKVSQMCPRILNNGIAINHDKKKSIAKLLERHYGKEWENLGELVFFKAVIHEAVQEVQHSETQEDSNCEAESVGFGI